jgi:predicted CxxxxCH...CXXCH cytochrome family protein
MNGVVNAGGGTAEVDLAPGGAPDASLKAQNAPGAAHTAGGTVVTDSRGMAYTVGGTCSGVYCHSRPTFATPDPIPASVRGDAGGFPLYFPPFTLSVAREYAAPTWGGAAPGCDGCHGFPPRTFAPGVSAGTGDSHSYIDSNGEENLHGAVHSFAPIACATCHFATVEAEGVRTTARRDGGTQYWSVYQAVPIANRASHVNGQPDIRFTSAPVRSVTSSPDNYFLADGGARYEMATKTCSGVSCHLLQTTVKWGTPYRPWSNYLECDSCHQY